MADPKIDVAEATRLAQQGGAALQRGDSEAARAALQPVADAGLANAQAWLSTIRSSTKHGTTPTATASS